MENLNVDLAKIKQFCIDGVLYKDMPQKNKDEFLLKFETYFNNITSNEENMYELLKNYILDGFFSIQILKEINHTVAEKM